MAIRLITGNQGKVVEFKALIPDIEMLDIDLPEIQEIDAKIIIEEKLRVAREQVDEALMVEDTSLYLDCMNGLPGPLIKWFMKTIGNEGLHKIAGSYDDFEATARTMIGFSTTDGGLHFFEGELHGKIVEPRGDEGFGWDPIFQPHGHDKTFAEMDIDEKNTTSMRKLAAIKLQEFLEHQS